MVNILPHRVTHKIQISTNTANFIDSQTQTEVTSPLRTSLPQQTTTISSENQTSLPPQTTTTPSETQPPVIQPSEPYITPPLIPAVPSPDSDPLDLNPLYASSPSLQPDQDSELQPEAESEPQPEPETEPQPLHLSPQNSPPLSPEPEP